MRLAKQRGIHCTPENWERIRRRARKDNETISRFGELCCRRAAEALGAPPSAPPGHPLALPERTTSGACWRTVLRWSAGHVFRSRRRGKSASTCRSMR